MSLGRQRVAGHVPELDGVRGLAVLGVMARHFFRDMEMATGAERAVYFAARMGSFGVDLFFVLSGFLITGILLDAKGKPGYFRSFYLRRTVRIFPLYYAALIVVFWFWPHVSPEYSKTITHAAEYQTWYWTYTANWLFAIEGRFTGLDHFWSLCVEEQFYLVWPVLVLLLSRRGLLFACAGIIGGVLALRLGLGLAGTDLLVPYVLTPTRIDALAMGAVVAALARQPTGLDWLLPHAKKLSLAATLVFLVLVVPTWGQGRSPVVMMLGGTVLAFVFALLLVLAMGLPETSLTRRVFGSSPMRFFGKYSYCLYVVHPFVQELAARHFRDDMLPRVHGSILLGRGVFVVLCTVASVAVALASWHLYEKHWLKLKRYS